MGNWKVTLGIEKSKALEHKGTLAQISCLLDAATANRLRAHTIPAIPETVPIFEQEDETVASLNMSSGNGLLPPVKSPASALKKPPTSAAKKPPVSAAKKPSVPAAAKNPFEFELDEAEPRSNAFNRKRSTVPSCGDEAALRPTPTRAPHSGRESPLNLKLVSDPHSSDLAKFFSAKRLSGSHPSPTLIGHNFMDELSYSPAKPAQVTCSALVQAVKDKNTAAAEQARVVTGPLKGKTLTLKWAIAADQRSPEESAVQDEPGAEDEAAEHEAEGAEAAVEEGAEPADGEAEPAEEEAAEEEAAEEETAKEHGALGGDSGSEDEDEDEVSDDDEPCTVSYPAPPLVCALPACARTHGHRASRASQAEQQDVAKKAKGVVKEALKEALLTKPLQGRSGAKVGAKPGHARSSAKVIKRPNTGFQLFSFEKRAEVSEQLPGGDSKEVMKLLSETWKEATSAPLTPAPSEPLPHS